MKRRISVIALSALLALVAVFTAACKKDGGNNGTGDNLVAPVISGFTLTPDTGSTPGKVNEEYVVSYTLTGSATSEVITAKKDGTDSTDFVYVSQSKKIKFTAAGAYEVKLTAMNGTKGSTATASLTVTNWSVPVITTDLAASGYVNAGITLEPAATYETGDAAGSSSVAIEYSAELGGSFAVATDEQGTYAANVFMPKTAGYFKLTLNVISAKGASASKVYNFQAVEEGAMVLDHDYPVNERIVAKTNEAKVLSFTAEGSSADNYNVSASANPDTATVTANASAKTISFTASAAGDYTVTLTYEHKTNPLMNTTLTFELKVKDNLTAPVFGTDPFAGMASTIRPNAGLLIYHDVTDDDTTITENHIEYSVQNITGVSGGVEAVSGNKGYRFFRGTAGTYKLIMTVKDDSDNEAKAEKTITVDDSIDFAQMGNIIYSGNDALGFNMDNYGRVATADSDTVMTKNGFISNRNNTTTDKAIGLLPCGDLGNNFEVILKIDVITSGSSILGGFWTGAAVGSDSPAGNMWFDWNASSAGVSGTDLAGSVAGPAPAAFADGSSFYIRYKRAVSAGTVTITVAYSTDNVTYITTATASAATSTVSGATGANVINIALWHNVGGVFMISGLQQTAL